MLRLQYFFTNSAELSFRRFVLAVLFLGIGFGIAFSSVDIPPFVFIHEAGHAVTARLYDVRLEKLNSSSYLMHLVKDEPLEQYVRVLRSGYKAELLFWYGFMVFMFAMNIVRIRRFKEPLHFLLPLFPGYAAGLFLHLKGTTDIGNIAELLGLAESSVIRRFIMEESAYMLILLSLYTLGFILYLRLRERRYSDK